MAEPCPELIFLSGPQRGERAAILQSPAVAGRSPQAEIILREQGASREQTRFELTREGWIMENLSANGTRVNGKRYKAGKKILLDTGDILGVGRDTEILYVAAGDDPDTALTAIGGLPTQAPPPAPQEELVEVEAEGGEASP